MDIADELAIQLYSLRNFSDLDGQLEALAQIGFKRVEITGGHLEDASNTRARLDAAGIKAPSGHVNMDMLRTRLDWVVEQAHIIGIEEIFLPALPNEERSMPAEGWYKAGKELGEIALKLERLGFVFGYHNHFWELQAYPDGTTPLQHLFEGAEGSPLTFEADLAWIIRGNADPAHWMEQLKSRLIAVHVKDLAEQGQNLDEDGWANIGSGCMDWPLLWKKAIEFGAKRMILEHDNPKDPIAFAKDSRTFLLNKLA